MFASTYGVRSTEYGVNVYMYSNDPEKGLRIEHGIYAKAVPSIFPRTKIHQNRSHEEGGYMVPSLGVAVVCVLVSVYVGACLRFLFLAPASPASPTQLTSSDTKRRFSGKALQTLRCPVSGASPNNSS